VRITITIVLAMCFLLSGCILSNDIRTEHALYEETLLTITNEDMWLHVVEEELLHFRYCRWCGVVQDVLIEEVAYIHEDNCPVAIAQAALGAR